MCEYFTFSKYSLKQRQEMHSRNMILRETPKITAVNVLCKMSASELLESGRFLDSLQRGQSRGKMDFHPLIQICNYIKYDILA